MRLILLQDFSMDYGIYVDPLDISYVRPDVYGNGTMVAFKGKGFVLVRETPEEVLSLVRRAVDGFEVITQASAKGRPSVLGIENPGPNPGA